MQELVSNARRMNDFLADISTAAREQSSGVTQVGTAVQDLDRMTQQNAALVEEASAAAQSLQEQAGSLSQIVSVFKLDAGSPPTHGAARVVSPAAPVARPASKLRSPQATVPHAKQADAPSRPAATAAGVGVGVGDWTEF